ELPQGVRPVLDARPHAPEVLLADVREGTLRLLHRHLPRRVVEHEHRGPEPVLELFVHRLPLLVQRLGWNSPKTSRKASETSPSVAPARSASFMGWSRLAVPRAVSATVRSAASTASWFRRLRRARTRVRCASTSSSSIVRVSGGISCSLA